jgi:hypothetical protein
MNDGILFYPAPVISDTGQEPGKQKEIPSVVSNDPDATPKSGSARMGIGGKVDLISGEDD